MKKVLWIIATVLLLFALSVFGFICNTGRWFAREAVKTAKQEFSPQEMLRKYEWFKDASAMLDKKVSDIGVYEERIKSMEEDYAGVSRPQWDRTDKEQFNQWRTELAGVKASYNGLCAEYNAQMAKFNWRFTNAGTLPAGATEPLPREYKPYQ